MYMSPEQVQGQPLDPRTDIYSFGVTCYQMLAGNPPFQGSNPFEVALKHVNTQPKPLAEVRPDLPIGLRDLIHKMMAKEVDKRHQSFHELSKDVARLRSQLNGHESRVQDPAPPPPAPPARATATRSFAGGRRRWLAGVVGLSLVLAFLGGAVLAYRQNPEPVAFVRTEGPRRFDQQREEELLRKQEAASRSKPGGPTQWLRPSLLLGLDYLEQQRLDEAEKLFVDLAQNVPAHRKHAFNTLARLGQAIILARKNKALASNNLFLEVLVRKHQVDGLPFLANSPHLWYQIECALDANKGNAPEILQWTQLGGLLAATPVSGPMASLAFLDAKPDELFPASLERYRNTTKNFGFKLTGGRKAQADPQRGKAGPKGKAK
jgi:serine/threonine-protein kinase